MSATWTRRIAIGLVLVAASFTAGALQNWEQGIWWGLSAAAALLVVLVVVLYAERGSAGK
jgi:predicted cobalt transporter CbtA